MTCDGKYNPAPSYNTFHRQMELTHWFTARTLNVLRAPKPAATQDEAPASDWDGVPEMAPISE